MVALTVWWCGSGDDRVVAVFGGDNGSGEEECWPGVNGKEKPTGEEMEMVEHKIQIYTYMARI